MAAPSQSVEEALQDALTHSTPAPMLIELIKAHPIRTTILDLISLYTELVAEQPNQVDKIAEALAEVRTSKVKIDSTLISEGRKSSTSSLFLSKSLLTTSAGISHPTSTHLSLRRTTTSLPPFYLQHLGSTI